jgi:hypothetical protein
MGVKWSRKNNWNVRCKFCKGQTVLPQCATDGFAEMEIRGRNREGGFSGKTVKLWQWFLCVCVCVCVCGYFGIGKAIFSLADPASCTLDTESPSEVKAAGTWRYHQLLSSPEVKGRAYTSTRPLGLHGLTYSEFYLTFYCMSGRQTVGFLEIVLSWIVFD